MQMMFNHAMLCSFAVAYKPSVLIPGMDHDMRSFPEATPTPAASIPHSMADGYSSNGSNGSNGSAGHVYSPPPDRPSSIVQVSTGKKSE